MLRDSLPEDVVGARSLRWCRRDWTTSWKSNIFLGTQKLSLCQGVLDSLMAGGWESIWYCCILLMLFFFSSLDACFWPFSTLHTELDGILLWPNVDVLMLPRTKIKAYDVSFCWKKPHKLMRLLERLKKGKKGREETHVASVRKICLI